MSCLESREQFLHCPFRAHFDETVPKGVEDFKQLIWAEDGLVKVLMQYADESENKLMSGTVTEAEAAKLAHKIALIRNSLSGIIEEVAKMGNGESTLPLDAALNCSAGPEVVESNGHITFYCSSVAISEADRNLTKKVI